MTRLAPCRPELLTASWRRARDRIRARDKRCRAEPITDPRLVPVEIRRKAFANAMLLSSTSGR